MELLKETKSGAKQPIPVIGVESSQMLHGESDCDQFSRTAECAYYKAEARGFEPGYEVEDWLAAEAEVT